MNLVELSSLHQFAEILNQVSRNDKSWKHWFDKDAPEEEVIPDGYNASLDTFRKLMLIRCGCQVVAMVRWGRGIAIRGVLQRNGVKLSIFIFLCFVSTCYM